MVLSSFLVLLLLLYRYCRSRRHDEESNVDRRCAMQADFESYRDQEIEKLKEEAAILKQQIMLMKKDIEEKGLMNCDTNSNERITGASPSLFESQLPNPSFDVEEPVFEAFGIRISLGGNEHPETETIQHSLPSELIHFDQLRREGRAFDKTIKTGDVLISVHKDLLGARIQFFENLLGENWRESSSDMITLSSEYNPKVIECLITWAYTGTLSIDLNTVQELMKTGAFLLLDTVVDECYQFIRKRIEYDEAIPLLHFCRSIDYDKRNESLMNFIAHNFVPISFTPEFLELTFDDIKTIVENDSINIDDERQVFDAINKWIENDENRKVFAPRLLALIYTPSLSPSFLAETVLNKKWIFESPECMDVINESLRIGKNSLITVKNSPRNNNVYSLIIVTSSNWDYDRHNNDYSTISVFDPAKNEWQDGLIECHDLLHYVVVIGDEIVFMGHKYDEETGDYGEGRITILNTRSNIWHKIRMPSLVDRTGGVYGVINGKIYSCGGDSEDLEPPTSYDPSNPSAGWTKLPNMTRCRQDAASCTLNGKFYVFGGHDSGRDCPDGEYYDPATNEWTRTSSMKIPTCNSGAAALNGEIYLVGGEFHGSPSTTLQKYVPETNTWIQLKPVKHPRLSPLVTSSGGKLYVTGSWMPPSASKPVLYMDKYIPETNEWFEVESMRELPNDPIMFAIPIPATFPTPNVKMP